jgi:hypothetical protein
MGSAMKAADNDNMIGRDRDRRRAGTLPTIMTTGAREPASRWRWLDEI